MPTTRSWDFCISAPMSGLVRRRRGRRRAIRSPSGLAERGPARRLLPHGHCSLIMWRARQGPDCGRNSQEVHMRLTVAASIVCVMLAQHASAQSNVVVVNNGGRILAVSDKPQTVTVTFQLTL